MLVGRLLIEKDSSCVQEESLGSGHWIVTWHVVESPLHLEEAEMQSIHGMVPC